MAIPCYGHVDYVYHASQVQSTPEFPALILSEETHSSDAFIFGGVRWP